MGREKFSERELSNHSKTTSPYHHDCAEESRAGFLVLNDAIDFLHRVGVRRIAPPERVRVGDRDGVEDRQQGVVGALGGEPIVVESWPLLNERVDQRRRDGLPTSHVNRSCLPQPLDRSEHPPREQAAFHGGDPRGERDRKGAPDALAQYDGEGRASQCEGRRDVHGLPAKIPGR